MGCISGGGVGKHPHSPGCRPYLSRAKRLGTVALLVEISAECRQLREYFKGERTSFSLALDFKGTEFQKRVWEALLTIPYGETRSYGQIAEQIGQASSLGAVGAANGKNPISIIAPCHRVIGSTGKLTGFAGGLEVKERLLA